jgi:hypothetical protein
LIKSAAIFEPTIAARLKLNIMAKIYKTTSQYIPEGRLVLEYAEDSVANAVDNKLNDAADNEEGSLYWITSRDKTLIRDLRHIMQENQTQFWLRFGVTQTRGSRFERGKPIPLSVLLLIRLYLLRIIDDTHLLQVRSPNFDSDGNQDS